MKTSELRGTALDWAVAKCEGLQVKSPNNGEDLILLNKASDWWYPSESWAQGGPIIEREGVSLTYENGDWCATMQGKPAIYFSYNPLVSAMRCYVASKLGEEVEIPSELSGG